MECTNKTLTQQQTKPRTKKSIVKFRLFYDVNIKTKIFVIYLTVTLPQQTSGTRSTSLKNI